MKVICFGDSNTYGYENLTYIGGRYDADSRWVDILAKKTGWTILNEGMNGREIPRNPIHIPEDTEFFIIMLGTNDLLQGNSAQKVMQRMKNFLNNLSISTDKILLIAPPPMVSGFWVSEDALIEESYALTSYYEKLSTESGVHFADAGKWNVSLVFDGIHFSKEGHQAFAEGLYSYLYRHKLMTF